MIQQNLLPRIVDATLRIQIIGITGFEEGSDSCEKLESTQNQNPRRKESTNVSTSTSLNKISDFRLPFLIEPERGSMYIAEIEKAKKCMLTVRCICSSVKLKDNEDGFGLGSPNEG